ncbi:MAG: cation transporter, partial [Flavobacteriaceae bacterium]|nr:cation transporter [Flavobacteriaceae bacterium]
SFGVRGNCGMCKTTIEKAANGVIGVSIANWNVDKKKIDVSFDGTKTNEMTIHKAIAASGYDTDKAIGDLKAYDGLVACCKYDHAMQMNQSGETKADDHSGHNH